MFASFTNTSTPRGPSALRSTSMIKRIAAITFIFLCTSFAWAILGATIFDRTYSSDNTSVDRVASTWGSAQNQSPPTASVEGLLPKLELPLESSHITVDLNLEHRQKGLLWYSTYKTTFDGTYSFRNTSDKEQTVMFALDFATAQAIYDDLVFTVDGAAVALKNEKNIVSGTARIG